MATTRDAQGQANPKTTQVKPTSTNTQKDPDKWVSGGEPMTGAQSSYLHTLADEAHKEPPADDLTKAEASKQIASLKQELELEPAPKK